MKKLKNAISWFDIPVSNMERAIRFYSTLFDIEMTQFNFGNGLIIAIFPTEDGTVGGTLSFHADTYFPSKTGTLIYLNGDPDLDIVLNKVEASGGKVLQPKTQISPHWGYMGAFEDSEGNRIALRSSS